MQIKTIKIDAKGLGSEGADLELGTNLEGLLELNVETSEDTVYMELNEDEVKQLHDAFGSYLIACKMARREADVH